MAAGKKKKEGELLKKKELAAEVIERLRKEYPDSGCSLIYDHTFLYAAATKSLQSCPTLCDPRGCSPPGSPGPGILQARTLECVAISFSRGSSRSRD